MTRTVFCKKFKKEMRGLDKPPFPGPRGEFIFEQVSMEAYLAWQQHQTRLINERQLSMMDAKARAFLNEQFDRFINDQAFEQADGYVPE